jgi:hypothetical protein
MSSHTLLFRAFIIVGLEWSKRIAYMDRALELGFLLGSDNASSCWASFMFSPWNSDEIVHQFMATEIFPTELVPSVEHNPDAIKFAIKAIYADTMTFWTLAWEATVNDH